jgi:DNA gyrase subunit B
MSFAKGIPQSQLSTRKADSGSMRGTTVLFKPDSSIFKTTVDFEFDKLAARIDELAYLNAGLTINLIDRRTKAMRQKQALVKSQTEDDEGMIPVNVEDEDGMHKILIKSEDEEKEILVDLEEDLPPRYPFLYNLDFLSTF